MSVQYKYYIEMIYIGKDNTQYTIKPENIKHLFIDSDYGSTYMPMIYAVINLDKNIYDTILKNAKTATITTNIYKVSRDDTNNTKIKTQYSGKCSYFVNGDINYNKEIDYEKPAGDTSKTREDIYREVHIGLIYKECIDNNKQTANTTIKETTMLNTVYSFLSKIPLLLENFTYNDVISQLVVPPQNSLSKTVHFFNSIKVFYSTPYRFFIEPGCTYLISSSGKPIQKKSEKYASIIFNIHSLTSTDAFVLGMSEDEKNKCYRIDINVKDTNYVIDNDTCKTVNNISSIINPSKENSLINSTDIVKTMAQINTISDGIISHIKKQSPTDVKPIPITVSNYKEQFTDSTEKVTEYCNTEKSLIDTAKGIITDLPETAPTDGTTPTGTIMTAEQKTTIKNQLTVYETAIVTNLNNFNNLNSNFTKSATNIMGCAANTTTVVPGLLRAIKPINITDNTTALKKAVNSAKTANTTNKSFISNTLTTHVGDGNGIANNIQGTLTVLTSINAPELADTINSMQTYLTMIQAQTTIVDNCIKEYAKFPAKLDNIFSTISPLINKFSGININLKEQFTNINKDIQNAAKAISTISSIVEKATSIVNSVKGGNISLSTIKSIAANINAISDISQIGKAGVSKFNINLDFASDSSSGTHIVRIANDNANLVKNIKANMENKANKLTLNKNDLDIEIFTMNKEYIVKNYDAHSNKDGHFLLNRKVEMFLRQDDHFLLNTMLEFDKLSNDSTGSKAVKELSKVTKVVKEVKTIESIYKKLFG